MRKTFQEKLREELIVLHGQIHRMKEDLMSEIQKLSDAVDAYTAEVTAAISTLKGQVGGASDADVDAVLAKVTAAAAALAPAPVEAPAAPVEAPAPVAPEAPTDVPAA
jgi:peptidoglycan hydrolase CwlO-like protein